MQYSRHTWIARIFSLPPNENMTIKSLHTLDILMLSRTVSSPLTTRENKLKLNWTVKRQSHYFRCYKVKQRPWNRYYCRGPICWFRCLVQMCFFSSSIPLRKICTIRYPKHSLESPWSILIAHLALCLQLTAKHSVCFIAPSACLLYVPCICDIFALRNDS